jgi:hypothetical protein
MPLVKETLQSQLRRIIESMPERAPAPQEWAMAYLSYASTAMSGASSFPVTAMANAGILIGAFTGAFASESASGSANAIAGGIQSFWQAMVWAGATASGTTLSAGNYGLSASLQGIFGDVEEKSAADKAGEIADAFHSGAGEVMVMDIPFAQPAPPITGPIS